MPAPNELKQEWIEALRSDEYSQARGELCRIDHETGDRSFCCLGVAGDLLVKKNLAHWSFEEGYPSLVLNDEPDSIGNSNYLPTKARSWFGLAKYLGQPNYHAHPADWNDDDRLSFAEIADRLEELPDLVGEDDD